MHRELHPEVHRSFTRVAGGRQLAIHHIDKFPRHWDQIRNSLDHEAPGEVNTLSVVRFELFTRHHWRLSGLPMVYVAGDGVGHAQIYAQGVGSEESKQSETKGFGSTWEVVNHEMRGATGLKPLLGVRPKKLTGVPTIHIDAFLGGSRYEVGALRLYNLDLGPGSDHLQVEADTRKEAEDESLSLRYYSDPRDNFVQELARLTPGPHGWVIIPSSDRHPVGRRSKVA